MCISYIVLMVYENVYILKLKGKWLEWCLSGSRFLMPILVFLLFHYDNTNMFYIYNSPCSMLKIFVFQPLLPWIAEVETTLSNSYFLKLYEEKLHFKNIFLVPALFLNCPTYFNFCRVLSFRRNFTFCSCSLWTTSGEHTIRIHSLNKNDNSNREPLEFIQCKLAFLGKKAIKMLDNMSKLDFLFTILCLVLKIYFFRQSRKTSVKYATFCHSYIYYSSYNISRYCWSCIFWSSFWNIY